ncbi:undecaprenyl/decaprenyl-phosphate alpha-N-acetylglucosaminyl 1-phosphate transferase [Patescibacteria group bacterium]|nr:undecaprenyl/decaprenyl-phosphate alpha-N-acetylglucosaminyl 1-phosphate transferase [Patescibacteria group bacterium]
MYLIYFTSTFVLSIFLTYLLRKLMRRFEIVDLPREQSRKIHKKKIPLGGGLAIFVSFFVVVAIALFVFDNFGIDVERRHILGLFIGGLILMIGGLLDDKYNFKARQQILFPILATLIIIAFGIGPHEITNPAGGVFRLDRWIIPIDGIGNWVVLADILVFFWLMGMMFTTKLLDGLDGLVAGLVSIGALMIFFLSTQTQWYQPEVGLLAIIFAGAVLGFLVWNSYPAKIFLGEGGSLFTGFMLGSLAIISGSKIATTLLVVAIPMLDIGRVMILRIKNKKSIFVGDSEHLHFKLLHSGLSQRQAVLFFYTIALLFGVTTLFLQSSEKVIALLFLFVLMLLVGFWFGKHKYGDDK